MPHRPVVAANRIVQSVSDLSSDFSRDLASEEKRAQGTNARVLSGAQLGIWFAQKLDLSSPAYNIGEYLEIDGPVVLPLFERALRQVVSESDSLCLQITEQSGEPSQRVGAPLHHPVPTPHEQKVASLLEGLAGAFGCLLALRHLVPGPVGHPR